MVSDHVSIRVRSTSRHHRLPRLYATTLSCKRTSFAREAVTRQSRPGRRLCAFLDPWLGRAPLVVGPHDGARGEREIRHGEADAREQLADVVLDFRPNPSQLQRLARGNPDGIRHVAHFELLVLWLGRRLHPHRSRALPLRLLKLDLRTSNSSKSSALWTLPDRSFAARQWP